jgi:hypothetical protein
MNKTALLYRLAFFLCLICLLFLTACDNNKTLPLENGYMSFILKDGIGHFSLEYPTRYQVAVVDVSNARNDVYTTVAFDWDPPKEREKDQGATSVIIGMKPADSSSSNVSLEESLLLSKKVHENYMLLDKFEVTVDGSQGQGAVYSWTALPDPSHGPSGAVAKSIISRVIYFDHDGLVWHIYMNSDTSNTEIDKTYLEHMIQTFKFLDYQ